jgi:hypothetical protein
MKYIEKLSPEQKRNYMILFAGAIVLGILDIWIFPDPKDILQISILLAIAIALILFLLQTIKMGNKKKGGKKSRKSKKSSK